MLFRKRDSFNGRTSVFQTEDAGSIPASRTDGVMNHFFRAQRFRMGPDALKKIILVFLLLYFIAGTTARVLIQSEERVYLVFSWYLYAKVPHRVQTEYSVLVDKIGDKTLSPPLLIDDTKDILYSGSMEFNHTLVHDVNDLGDAFHEGRTQDVEAARRRLEAGFLHTPVVYELVELASNPIERWKTGKFISIKHLAVFNSNDHE